MDESQADRASAFRTLEVSNVRSIAGEITVPLDASVVLVHGPNGSGKTTVLSAFAAVLMGEMPGTEVAADHILNRGADSGSIILTSEAGTTQMNVSKAGVEGDSVLSEEDAGFFRERCLLEQQVLSRLLEQYEGDTEGGAAAITQFVRELLGIDDLDSIIEGLHLVDDTRRVRAQVPEFETAERILNSRQDAESVLNERISSLDKSVSKLWDQLEMRQGEMTSDLRETKNRSEIVAHLRSNIAKRDEELWSLKEKERSLDALKHKHQFSANAPSLQVSQAEIDASKTKKEADGWRGEAGQELHSALNRLAEQLPGTSSSLGTADPLDVQQDAVRTLDQEVAKHRERIAAEEKKRVQLAAKEIELEASRKALQMLDEDLADSSSQGTAEELARILASLVPHLESNQCPVCDRDFSEASDHSLSSHLVSKVAAISKVAVDLGQTAERRLDTLSQVKDLETTVNRLKRDHMTVSVRKSVDDRIESLVQLRGVFLELEDAARRGSKILRAEAHFQQLLDRITVRNKNEVEIRETLREIVDDWDSDSLNLEGSTKESLTQVANAVTVRIDELESRAKSESESIRIVEDMVEIENEIRELSVDQEHTRAEVASISSAFEELNRRRSILKELRKVAQETRGLLINRAFTETLNKTWRQLFVRLAPNERFVPQFVVPESLQSGEIQLTTIHGDGGQGGPPLAVLSAGNLNTAALSLFLALNLSVASPVSWLVLDDPVQSMDEIHVAQFAALLRTLTRGHGKQIMLAVHERALFDYLRLELSPSQPGESVVAIELSMAADGSTTARTDFLEPTEELTFA